MIQTVASLYPSIFFLLKSLYFYWVGLAILNVLGFWRQPCPVILALQKQSIMLLDIAYFSS